MEMNQLKQDADRIAALYKESGVESATEEFRHVINQPNYPYWITLALKDEVRKLVGA
jgi:ABC-type antimicrobial peptide transport system ATPase subunit